MPSLNRLISAACSQKRSKLTTVLPTYLNFPLQQPAPASRLETLRQRMLAWQRTILAGSGWCLHLEVVPCHVPSQALDLSCVS